MSIQDKCPFCDRSTILQNASFSNHYQTPSNPRPEIASPDGPISLPDTTDPTSYYTCDNCKIDYVNETIRIDEIVKFLGADINMALMLNYYYGSVPVDDLFIPDNVRLFRKPSHAYSFFSKGKAKSEILFVLNRNNVKTSGKIIKKNNKSYEITVLERVV